MKKLTIEFIRKQFEREGYKLLSDEYINAKAKLNYRCSNGHKHSISWANWQQGRRCPYCYGNVKLDIVLIHQSFESENYKLLTKIYKNAFQKLDYICPNGHRHFIKWNNWQQGDRCFYCFGKIKNTLLFVKNAFNKEDYVLLTNKYKNNRQKLECICPNGHEYKVSWRDWISGSRCFKCNNQFSKWEKEVGKFLRMSGIKIVENDRTKLINPNTNRFLELDIWFPQLNKAIECNGVYWHSKNGAIKNDRIKQQLCQQQRIDLLIITDKEWDIDIDKCKEKIKTFVTGV